MDAEVPARGLEALPAPILVALETNRSAFARRRHRETGVAFDARDEEVLGRGAERDARVAHGPVPDRLAESESGEHEALVRHSAQRHRTVARSAYERVPATTVTVAHELDLRLAAFAVARDEPQRAVALGRARQRVIGGERHLEAAARVGLERQQLVRAGLDRHARPRRHRARTVEPTGHGERDVIE